MQDNLVKELEKIGLSDKEAKVYLAGLETGPSTAQTIAAKATVNRPTTYVAIESLIKRGLMSSFQKGKKRYFKTSSPNHLLYIVDKQRVEIEKKASDVEVLANELNKLINDISKSNLVPDVKLFEGYNGLSAVQDDILHTDTQEICELTSLDVTRKHIPKRFEGDVRQKIVDKFKVRSLYTSQDASVDEDDHKNVTSRVLSNKEYDIGADLIIYGDSVALTSYGRQPNTVVIKDDPISVTLKTLFDNLWNKSDLPKLK